MIALAMKAHYHAPHLIHAAKHVAWLVSHSKVIHHYTR